MAVTKILPVRASIAQSVAYICNPDKTDGQLYVHSGNCFPETAALEFQHYMSLTRAGGNTAGRHLIQSFAPGEVTPGQAHEIGKELAGEILKGEYAYVLATHTDRGHVHNHFVWCAANIVTHKRYRSNKNTYREIREASDRLCKENSLSVVIPHAAGKSYTEYNAERQGASWKAKLREAIDTIIAQSASFDEFLKGMKTLGYEIKRGKYISFRAPGQERFTRAKTLGEAYSEDIIKQRIVQKTPIESEPPVPAMKPAILKPIIDIKKDPKYRENRGLEQWAKIQNLKNTVEAYNLMQEYGGKEAFLALFNQCRDELAELENARDATEERIKALVWRRDDIAAYNRTKPIYQKYKETRFFQESFRKKHEADIETHEEASRNLKNVKRPLPKVKDIDNTIAKLREINNDNNKRYAHKKSELQQLKNIHNYIFMLDYENRPKQPEPHKRTRSNDLSR